MLILGSFQVGTITATYDPLNCSSLSFPTGFVHDLSLIIDKDLPGVTSSSGMPPLIGWVDYSAALDGDPILCDDEQCRYERSTAGYKFKEFQGRLKMLLLWGPITYEIEKHFPKQHQSFGGPTMIMKGLEHSLKACCVWIDRATRP